MLGGACECGTVEYRVCGRLRVRDELPLLALPCGNRVGPQGVAGIQREKLELTAGGDALLL
jgi:hypothetical protein